MPILPELKKRYPNDWELVRARILKRAERDVAGWGLLALCEWCGAANGQPHPVTGSKVVLTIAHLNHNPADNVDENLAALCQKCHNNYDAPMRQMKKEVKRQVWDAMRICCSHLRRGTGKKKAKCTLYTVKKVIREWTPGGTETTTEQVRGSCVFYKCPLIKAYRRDYRKEKRKGDGQ